MLFWVMINPKNGRIIHQERTKKALLRHTDMKVKDMNKVNDGDLVNYTYTNRYEKWETRGWGKFERYYKVPIVEINERQYIVKTINI